MSEKKYLDESGVSRLIDKIKTLFAPLSHTHDKSQITDFPSAMKNPSALTFTGGVSETYDGSSKKVVNIPTTMKGATDTSDGASGLVTTPPKGASNRYLRSDGTWSVPPDTNTTYSNATTSSAGLMSSSDKSKLDGIASGANKYVHPDYTEKANGLYKVTVDSKGHVSATTAVTKADITALGIPGQDTNTTYETGTASTAGVTKLYTSTGTNTDGTMTQKAINDALSGKAAVGHDHTISNITGLQDSLDSKALKEHNHAISEVTGLQAELDGKSSTTHTHDNRYYTESEIDTKLNAKSNTGHAHAASDITSGTLSADRLPSIPVSKLNGVINAANLPSYVDDVMEYTTVDDFPKTGEAGKIYVATKTNLTYRWGGSGYVEISPSLALGTTASTAYRGDLGQIAYTHSQITSGNPHKVTKSDVGLGNVDNTADANKSVKYATTAGSSSTATTATKLSTTTAGSATQPVYFANGIPVAGKYTLGDVVSRNVRNIGTTTNLGWVSASTDANYIPTINTLAYWNGAYNSSNSSNLAYCNQGAFGTIVTKSAGDYAAVGHAHTSVGGVAVASYIGNLASNGWKNLGGKSSGLKVTVGHNIGAANWNSGTYSSSIVFGAEDTKGLLDVGYASPVVTFGGGSTSGSSDSDPAWYYKLSGTSGQVYALPSSSKTLAATDGSNAYGTWGISISGNAASANGVTPEWSGSLGTSDTSWLTAWSSDGKKLKAFSTSNFAPASHGHGQYYDSTISRTANTVLAAPNGSAGGATFRKLVAADLPSHDHYAIRGSYTGNGGQQAPSYIGNATVKFNMMNTTINSDSNYKDFILMDTYNGGDVPYVTALGIDKAATARAFIMSGKKGGSSWDYKAELISTQNIGSQSVNYATSSGSASSASTATIAAKLGRNGSTSTPMTFNWSGQSGQPTWLWGGTDGTNMYVYNPSNFSVNYATSAGSASSATYLNIVAGDEIRMNKPNWSAKRTLWINYSWSSGRSSLISQYNFADGNGTLTNVAANTFIGTLSGNATSATNAEKLNGYYGSVDASASTYVRRDSSNYVYLNYINSNTSNNENPAISQIIVTNGSDHYYRKASLAHLKSSLGSMPASDVYSWAKASSKPSYSWSEISSKPILTTTEFDALF